MPAGEYVYPFKFTFPGNQPLPPSLEGRYSGTIKYRVESKIHRPGLKLCDTKRVPIIFVPKLDVNNPEYDQPVIVSESKVMKSLVRKNGPINATMTVPRKAWAPGDRFEIKLDIFNNSSKVLDGFATVLRTHYTILSDLNKSESEKSIRDIPIETFPDIIPPMGTLSKKISVTIPPAEQTIPMELGRAMERLYSVGVIIEVPGLHSNLTLLVPVVIGTIPYNKAPQSSSFGLSSGNPLSANTLSTSLSSDGLRNGDDANEPSAKEEGGDEDAPAPDYLSSLHSQLDYLKAPVGDSSTNTN